MRVEAREVEPVLDGTTATFASAEAAPAPVMMKSMAMRGALAGNGMAEEQPAPESAPAEEPQQPRMVFHEGWIHLRSTNPSQTLDSAGKMALALGGYIEQRDQNSTVLRIPVNTFRQNFDAFVALGTLLRKEIRTEDITEQFLDNELRLRVAKETLERMQTLLAESLNPEEKLRLLREIQRLTKQIELQEANKRDLEKKAAFSRLNLNVDPFVFEGANQEESIGAFRWIAELRPLRTQETQVGKELELKAPQSFVDLDLDSKLIWASAANDGCEFWAYSKDNEPKGDATFWNEALRIRLSKSFAKAEVRDANSWKVLILESYDAKPYSWLVAVRTQKDDLQIAEAFFPSPEALAAHLEAVLTVLKESNP